MEDNRMDKQGSRFDVLAKMEAISKANNQITHVINHDDETRIAEQGPTRKQDQKEQKRQYNGTKATTHYAAQEMMFVESQNAELVRQHSGKRRVDKRTREEAGIDKTQKGMLMLTMGVDEDMEQRTKLDGEEQRDPQISKGIVNVEHSYDLDPGNNNRPWENPRPNLNERMDYPRTNQEIDGHIHQGNSSQSEQFLDVSMVPETPLSSGQ